MEQSNPKKPLFPTDIVTGKDWDRAVQVQEALVLLNNDLFDLGYSVSISISMTYKHMTFSLFREDDLIDGFNFFFHNRFAGNDFNAAIDKIAEWKEKFGGANHESCES